MADDDSNSPLYKTKQPWFLLVEPEPAPVRGLYQTVHESLDAVDQNEAVDLLASIKRAASEDRMVLQERRHVSTGAWGLIIAECWRPNDSAMNTVIAELLSEWPHEFNDAVNLRFNHLGWSALNDKLCVVMHTDSPDGRRVAFLAAVALENGHYRFSYLARLLWTEHELSQWGQR